MGNDINDGLRHLIARSSGTAVRVLIILRAGRESWKSNPFHPPNGLVPKMDDAQAGDRCPTMDINKRVGGGRRGCNAALGVNLNEYSYLMRT